STGMSDSVYGADISALASGLSALFGNQTAWSFKNKIQKARERGLRYIVLQNKVSYQDVLEVEKLPLFIKGRYQGGLILVQTNDRVKSYKLLASRTIGYLNQGDEGTTVGIEGAYDSYLKGRDGLRHEQRLGGGTWIPTSVNNEVDPQDGYDVVTTLDIDFQDVAEKALYDLLKIHNAHHGCAVLMEVKTGAIKAIANLGQAADGEYYELKNYAIWEITEPGSTFKLPALMAALEDGYVDLEDTVNTFNGKFDYYDREIVDAHTGGFGILTVAEVLEKSSNIGMARIIDRHYKDKPKRFVDRLYAMGLKNPMGIEISGEQDPYIKNTNDNWSKVSLGYMAHGYELLMTPLQVLGFYNAVANGGKYVRPRLVQALKDHSQVVKEFKPEVLKHSICSNETLKKARMLLEGAVEHGTATNLISDQYRFAGKTGTAVIAQGDQGYVASNGNKEYRASFVGYFPAEEPAYSCIVVITRPNMGVYYGNKVAGKVFREIADKVYATNLPLHKGLEVTRNHKIEKLPVMKSGYWPAVEVLIDELKLPAVENGRMGAYARVFTNQDQFVIENLESSRGIVPDATGMGLVDALPLIENAGFRIKISGYGKVINQSIDPGSEMPLGTVIHLKLTVT
ncbi:MAG: transpeptidase family protein, partial [Bacteroidetes bacterium]|nr:transpeptidase family protein [Bacteroidota bacterium]